MTANTQEGSAKIFQFPPRGRFAVSAQQTANSDVLASVRAPRIAYDSWYHDDAIEAERQRSN